MFWLCVYGVDAKTQQTSNTHTPLHDCHLLTVDSSHAPQRCVSNALFPDGGTGSNCWGRQQLPGTRQAGCPGLACEGHGQPTAPLGGERGLSTAQRAHAIATRNTYTCQLLNTPLPSHHNTKHMYTYDIMPLQNAPLPSHHTLTCTDCSAGVLQPATAAPVPGPAPQLHVPACRGVHADCAAARHRVGEAKSEGRPEGRAGGALPPAGAASHRGGAVRLMHQ